MGRRRNASYALPAGIINEPEGREDSGSAASLLVKIVLPQAVKLARSGHYPDAEQLLLLLIREGAEQPVIYDLLARIQAQQGRYTEAEISWSTALRFDPANKEYQLGLRRIRLQNGAFQGRPIRGWFWGIAIILCIIATGFSTWHYRKNLRSVRIPVPVFRQITTVSPRETPQQTAGDQAREHDLQILAKEFRIPGATVIPRNGEVTIVFNTGLFQRGAKLLPKAQSDLKILAEQLRPHKNRVLVHVEGHTDNMPMPLGLIYRDNVSLGLQRAVAVVDYLRAQDDLPATMFTVSSLGEAPLLYPNDTSLNKLRNRTVLIRITPLKRQP